MSWNSINNIIVKLLLILIDAYKIFISPIFPATCRFHPTCSNYCKKALNRYGLIKGSYLAIKRLFRCHPWHPGGFDPVP